MNRRGIMDRMKRARPDRPGWIVPVVAGFFAVAYLLTRLRAYPLSYMIMQGQPFSDPAGTLFGVLSWQAGLGLTHSLVYPFQSYRPGQALIFNALDVIGDPHRLIVPFQQGLALLAGIWLLLRTAAHPRLFILVAAALAGILVDPLGPLYDATWLTESLGRTLAVLTAGTFALAVVEGSGTLAWACGLIWGFENLVRPLTLLGPFGLVAAAGVFALAGRDRHRLMPVALRAAAGFLVVIVPWLVRNWIVTGRPMFSVWSLMGAVPLACGHVLWDSSWDPVLWWSRMHLSEGALSAELARNLATCIVQDPVAFLALGIRGLRHSLAILAEPARPLLILGIAGLLLILASAPWRTRSRSWIAGAVLVLAWCAAIATGHPWAAGAFLLGLGMVLALGRDRETAPLALLLTANLVLACTANGLTYGVGRVIEVLAWSAWPLLTAAAVADTALAAAKTARRPPAAVQWLGGFLASVPVLVLAAAAVTQVAQPRRSPAVDRASCDNQKVFDRIVAGSNTLPASRTSGVTLAGYVAGPVCGFRAGDGDDRARAYRALRDRNRVVFELVTPVTHRGRRISTGLAVLLPDTLEVAAWPAGTPVSVHGTLRFDPQEPYVGRYLLVADRIGRLTQ